MAKGDHKFSFIRDALDQRKAEHRFRELSGVEPVSGTAKVIRGGRELLNFCSNDYLGLSQHPRVIARSRHYLEKYGSGSGASRLVSGTLDIHLDLEEKLASAMGTEAAILFNSGFQANTSILPTITDRNSLILADKKVHNSLIQGSLLSRANFKRFNHNDMAHLEELLSQASEQSYNRVVIVSETVFSMDGDRSPLDVLIRLSDNFGAILYSDDAHALGVLGEDGLGLNKGKSGVDINLGTFGKSFGAFGAFAGCSSEMKDYLINFSPGFIYTTALPPAVIGALEASLELIPAMDNERKQLFKNVDLLKSEIHDLGFRTGDSETQIIPVIIGSEEETLKLSTFLEERGIGASAIRPPTVEKGASRIRITLSVMHSQDDIEQLIQALSDWNTSG